MSHPFPISHSDPILTADTYLLGQAVRLYHRQSTIEPEEELFAIYLMVSNLKIGDEFYVPLHFLTGYDAATGAHTLNISLAKVQTEQLTTMPHFIAVGQAIIEELPPPPSARPEPKAKEIKTAPLPPNW